MITKDNKIVVRTNTTVRTVDLRTAITIVPEFNREGSIETFSSACIRANRSVDATLRPFLLNMMRTKCVGKADTYLLRANDYNDLDSLLSELERALGPRDIYHVLTAKFSRIYQAENEPVCDFGTRDSPLLNRPIDVISRTYGGDKAVGLIEGARNIAVDVFITGLRDTIISNRVDTQRQVGLEPVIHCALEAET